MDKILFLKETDRMAASGTNAGTREYVYKKAAPVTGTKPKRDEAGFIVPYAMFHPIEKYRTIKKQSSPPHQNSSCPKPRSHRTCHIEKACISQAQPQQRRSAGVQSGNEDTGQ